VSDQPLTLSDLQHTEQIVICSIQGQIPVLGIALQPTLPFQVTHNPLRYLMHRLSQLSTGRFIDPMEMGSCTLGISEVDTVQEQHLKALIKFNCIFGSESNGAAAGYFPFWLPGLVRKNLFKIFAGLLIFKFGCNAPVFFKTCLFDRFRLLAMI
jgi:hypothetical protein